MYRENERLLGKVGKCARGTRAALFSSGCFIGDLLDWTVKIAAADFCSLFMIELKLSIATNYQWYTVVK